MHHFFHHFLHQFLAVYIIFGNNYHIDSYPIVLKNKKTSISPQSSSLEKGFATYYNPKYNGSKTASGEILDIRELTCAHPAHPFGTRLKVKSLETQKSIVVKVNDRGPSNKKYAIMLTPICSKALALDKKEGANMVEIEVLETENTPPPALNAQVEPDKEAMEAEVIAEKTTNEKAVTTLQRLGSNTVTAPSTEEETAAQEEIAVKDPTLPSTIFPALPTADEAAESEKSVAETEKVADDIKENEVISLQVVSYTSKKIETQGFAVQFAAMSDYEHAMAVVQNLGNSGIKDVIVSQKTPKTNNLYKVFVGPLESEELAFSYQRRCQKAGINCHVVNLETMEPVKITTRSSKSKKK